MQDTALPGGFYRDQTYLKGAVAVLSNRRKLNLPGLMCGKICFDTLKRLDKEGTLNYDSNLTPPFMNDMALYHKALDTIAEVNHI
jgi:hypothetical protein